MRYAARVRLALLGPCDGDVASLARAAHTALEKLEADRVIYLGTDDALDDVVTAWADLLGAVEPLAGRMRDLLDADAERLDEELARERARRRLERLRAVAGPGVRSVELLHDRILLVVDDKSGLDEEDLLPATFIVFGRGEPTVRRVGTRVFLCTGSTAKPGSGLLLLDEGEAGSSLVSATLHDARGEIVFRETLDTARSVKMKVQGAAG